MNRLFRSALLLLLLGSLPAFAARPFPPAPDDYAVMRGRVSIKAIDEHTIGIAVTDDRRTGEIHVFRLWLDAPFEPFAARFESASIEFRGSELVVMDADSGSFYAFATAAGDSTVPRAPRGVTAVRYIGYGLNHEIREAPLPAGGRRVRALEDCVDYWDCTSNKDYEGGGGGGTMYCASGGPGSTSCSAENSGFSCSVTCSSGYYACCNYQGPTCRCLRN